jgi:4-hydroxybenzoate polyprenyltransferase
VIETAAPAASRDGRPSTSPGVLAGALRVRQWTKNLLLFAGLLFASKLGDPHRWGEAFLAFFVYCAASSSAYLVNDVRDVERDRLHPTKRLRPVARGFFAPSFAITLSTVLAAAALGGATILGLRSIVLAAVFLIVQLAYSFALKRVVGIDVATIALLFAIRAAAGAEAIHVRVSPWLIACTALLALFLALAKRRGELRLVDARRGSARTVLSRYSLAVLDRLLVTLGVTTAVAYGAYAFGARHSPEVGLTIPFVVFGLGRYLHLIRRDGVGEAPEEVLLTDVPIVLSLACWAVTAAVVLTTS